MAEHDLEGELDAFLAGLVVFGHMLGVSADMTFALAMVKRLRELAWGVPALVTWQWAEARRLRRAEAS